MRSQEPFSQTGDGRRFHVDTYVGLDRRTVQIMIHSDDGRSYARTVLLFPESIKWDKDELAKIRAIPWSLHTPKGTDI